MMVMLCLTHLHLVATLAGGKCSRAVASGDPGLACSSSSLFANPVKKNIYIYIVAKRRRIQYSTCRNSVMIIWKVSVKKSYKQEMHEKCKWSLCDSHKNMCREVLLWDLHPYTGVLLYALTVELQKAELSEVWVKERNRKNSEQESKSVCEQVRKWGKRVIWAEIGK